MATSFVNTKLPPFTFDHERAEALVLKLYNDYLSRNMLYAHENASTAPQNKHKPWRKVAIQTSLFDDVSRITTAPKIKPLSLKHFIWIFFATLTDRRQVSDEVYKAHCVIYNERPYLYSKKAIKENPEALGEYLATKKVGVPRQSAEYWVRCAKTLFERFSGDPLKLLKHCGDNVEGVQKFKEKTEKETGSDPLPGYGPKITSLFTLFLAELGVYQMPRDAFPVDVHVQAIFLQQEIIVPVERDTVNDELEDFLRKFLCEMAFKHDLDKVHLSHAFWIKGAKLCTGCSRRKAVQLLCSIESSCLGRVDTNPYFKAGVWEFPLTFMRKGNHRKFKIENKNGDDTNHHLFED